MKKFLGFVFLLAVVAAIVYGIDQYGKMMSPQTAIVWEWAPEGECQLIGDRFEHLVTQALRCEIDSDCVVFASACGLLSACEVAINSGYQMMLTTVQNDFSALDCSSLSSCPPCPQYIRAPVAHCENTFCKMD